MSSIQRVCTVENCDQFATTKGWCNTHYWRFWKYGDVNYPTRQQKPRENGINRRGTPLYDVWSQMRQRCNNPNHKVYRYYGGRGIKVCERWQTSFKNFLSDMGEKPSSKHSLDRKDNDGDYSPDNCRWVLKDVQSWNRRRCKSRSGFRGVYQNQSKWVANIGIDSKSFYIGIYETVEEAAVAYDIAAIFFRGSEAKTNFL